MQSSYYNINRSISVLPVKLIDFSLFTEWKTKCQQKVEETQQLHLCHFDFHFPHEVQLASRRQANINSRNENNKHAMHSLYVTAIENHGDYMQFLPIEYCIACAKQPVWQAKPRRLPSVENIDRLTGNNVILYGCIIYFQRSLSYV